MRVLSKWIILIFVFFLIIANLAYPQEYKPSNIILITIDALRFDHLSCYGYRRNTSSNIDKLAREGVLFAQAISQAPSTLASMSSLLTSVYPTKLRFVSNKLDFYQELSNLTFFEILKKNDYTTASFIANVILWREAFQRSVDYFYKFKYTRKNYLWISPAEYLTEAVLEWFRNKLSLPFFMWLHYLDPHSPYNPPKYKDLFLNEVELMPRKDVRFIKGAREGKRVFGGIPVIRSDNKISNINYYIALYDSEVRYVDEQIGILLDYLKEKQIYDNSIIIITSDHGEAFGEHNLYLQHAHTLYDELLHVPLIIKFPYGTFGGRFIKNQVRLIDIIPTILEYLNLNIPKDIDGKSLMPLINVVDQDKSSYSFSYADIDKISAIRTEEWKLIYHNKDNSCELYNLKQDPNELVNLYQEKNEIAHLLKAELDKYLRFSLNQEETLAKFDKLEKKILRSLGYLQ